MSLLAPYAAELLRTRKDGATTADLIEFARSRGVLSGNETHRELSGIGHVFPAVGGENSGKTRASHLPHQKGIRQVVWTRSPYRKELPPSRRT